LGPDQEKKPTEEMNYYRDLVVFTADWFRKAAAEKKKVNMSEIVGGLEMMKQEFYITQTWFTSKVAKHALVNQMKEIAKVLGKDNKTLTITMNPDGSVIVRKDA
jgi:hypothetical protein